MRPDLFEACEPMCLQHGTKALGVILRRVVKGMQAFWLTASLQACYATSLRGALLANAAPSPKQLLS